MFKKLGLAITFSPTGKALLQEAERLRKLFEAELILIHVGAQNSHSVDLLNNAVLAAGIRPEDAKIVWTEGDPANAIIEACEKQGVDLLIAGALEKEKLIKYYLGSVARKLMRNATCPVLILKAASLKSEGYNSFYVLTDYTAGSERAIRTAYDFALLEKAEEFRLIRDYNIPGLASVVLDSGSLEKVEAAKAEWQREEEEKMRAYARELNLRPLQVKCTCLYGKEGWETSNFVRNNEADIFAVYSPARKFRLLDRIFPHEEEFSFEKLPSNLLIIR